MKAYLLASLFIFGIIVVCYCLAMHFEHKKIQLSHIGIIFAVVLVITIYTALKKPKDNLENLEEALSPFSDETIEEYIRDNYSFSDIVDVYGEDILHDYLWYHRESLWDYLS